MQKYYIITTLPKDKRDNLQGTHRFKQKFYQNSG